MIAQVAIDPDGGVTVVCDSDEALDEEAQRLQGLQLDSMLDRASATAIQTWLEIRTGGDDGNADS